MSKYSLNKKLGGVRIGRLQTPHGEIETPFFMPVGTVGSVKGISPEELKKIGAQIVLSNTYHLYLRPGERIIKKLGGLHKFMGWSKPILTDSGGYQVFSLSAKNSSQFSNNNFQLKGNLKAKTQPNSRTIKNLVTVKDDGVEFTSHLDGSKHFFTPEKVIQIQLDLGVDILMPLDVCPSGKATKEEVARACELTIKWAKRAKKYFDKKLKSIEIKKRPLLFGIVQGGLYEDLRRTCAKELIALNFDGYSVGGLAVDHETRDMWETVRLMGEILPEEKPRYLMGVGTPSDIAEATALGMDMFDCVLPTRLARHGSVYIEKSKRGISNKAERYQLINLLNSKYRTDGGVIEKKCGCPACSGGYSRAYISHLVRSGEMFGLRLTTLHNLYKYLDLMKNLTR